VKRKVNPKKIKSEKNLNCPKKLPPPKKFRKAVLYILFIIIKWSGFDLKKSAFDQKNGEGKDFIIPSTFRDKTNVSFPTLYIFLSAHPFGHRSSQDYLMASVKPFFSHPRLFGRRQIKNYKCQKSCQASLFD
tara:strand:+ start:1780 stop:2175 length:396 start_codon:yes stop_codon:yes gene_type:complete